MYHRIAVVLFFIPFLIPSIESIRQSYTLSGHPCMSDCVNYKHYYYCYISYFKWNYCEPNYTGKDIQYFTARGRGDASQCTSHCHFDVKYRYQWCFTSSIVNGRVGWNWDYCGIDPEQSVKGNRCHEPCERRKSGTYGCMVLGNISKTYEMCAPEPEFDVMQVEDDNEIEEPLVELDI